MRNPLLFADHWILISHLMSSHFSSFLISHFSFLIYLTMFDKIKLMFQGASVVLRHSILLGKFITAWNAFPGLESSENLRIWLRPLLLDAHSLALVTKTPIDDAIAIAALRITENDKAWAAVHAMALLAQDGFAYQDGVVVPESTAYQDIMTGLSDAALEILPGCPVLFHAAIGLLLLLLQRKVNK